MRWIRFGTIIFLSILFGMTAQWLIMVAHKLSTYQILWTVFWFIGVTVWCAINIWLFAKDTERTEKNKGEDKNNEHGN